MMVTSMLYLTLKMNYLSITLFFMQKTVDFLWKYSAYRATLRLMAEDVIAPPGEFCKLNLSKEGFQAASFNRCLHYVRRGVSF